MLKPTPMVVSSDRYASTVSSLLTLPPSSLVCLSPIDKLRGSRRNRCHVTVHSHLIAGSVRCAGSSWLVARWLGCVNSSGDGYIADIVLTSLYCRTLNLIGGIFHPAFDDQPAPCMKRPGCSLARLCSEIPIYTCKHRVRLHTYAIMPNYL